ncbi:ergothioneine biosynthesis protein EgtC [Planomonospora parontospora]|uniref:ergothioneine biosynthesis protein EgtC n=1 Tax=Planomonospora parontospora TaxID=58119 RepID=UPI00166FCFA4|nr:ergothioneine biosynthesis protein EgtC [Planomonospora parontospora]GGL14838.1 gamma-glutamyl-hercynylcysteine sulfoxide hydrolase [Planomonospora parontospora subsp. antibiotica]GII15871.1 gamma-glutamyl-hercynylcysteine sulfoxide hydrolase [Planomonospora parontospora subsp. antibiotica]
MCRHLAYLGPPVTLHELLHVPEHSLLTQSYAPRRQQHGLVNADGYGVGWYHPGRARPVRYRRAAPMWADASFAEVAQVVSAACVLAAVRSATPGFPVDESCAQPFTCDDRLFSHNGRIDDFTGVEERLRGLGEGGVPDARAPVDSALLFAMAVRLWRRGSPLDGALASVAARAAALAPGRYNLLATDGVRLAATACGDSLYLRCDGESVVIASEPFDDDARWRPVPDGSLVTADAHGAVIRPIKEIACLNPLSSTT